LDSTSAPLRAASRFVGALRSLGIGAAREGPDWATVGKDGKPQFWFGSFGAPAGTLHIALAAEGRDQVRHFCAAAPAAGGKGNGPAGLRENCHADHDAAFVIGPDGRDVEAVCLRPAA